MDKPSAYPELSTYDLCAESIYNNTKLTGKPGLTYTYNSVHLQLAGAMALAATGETDIQKIVSKYLFEPYEMTSTTCAEPTATIPQLAICLETVGNDYANFLDATFNHKVLPADLVAESEKDYTEFEKGYTLYGHYGFGHFLECYDSVAGQTPECTAAQIHADPGALGYYPLIDRTKGYYMQIVANEGGKFYPRSGIPEYLRFATKPLVDAVMAGEAGNSASFGHHTPSKCRQPLVLPGVRGCAYAVIVV